MAPKNKTKEDYVNELMELGENAPQQWTVTEIKARIREIKKERNMPLTKGSKTELQLWVIQMNRASKKKSDLQLWCQAELGLSMTHNETINQLQKKAMEKIYQKAAPHPTDPVGFGEHCSLSYEELRVSEAAYAQWVLKTAQEGQCCYRMQRLAVWLANTNQRLSTPPEVMVKPKQKTPSEASGSTANTEVMEAMKFMMNQMKEMKDELDVLRGRPHKKPAKDEDMESSQSWSAVSQTPQLQPQ